LRQDGGFLPNELPATLKTRPFNVLFLVSNILINVFLWLCHVIQITTSGQWQIYACMT